MSLDKPASWDKTSAEYTKMGIQGPILYPCKRMLAAMDTASSFSSATSILDIGCGPGTAVTLLAEDYGTQIPAGATLVATDFSQSMVDATLAKKQNIVAAGTDVANCWGRLEAQVMDAQNLSAVESGSVSHLMGSLVYFMLPDANRGLLEANRVLKEGGVFACTSWGSTMEWVQFSVEAAQRVRPDKVGKSVRLSPSLVCCTY
jgi:ubiquinone/menaquinone biosynthesis C-methylase UbiE